MPFPQEIQTALEIYDTQKGFWRRLFGDQAAIRALRKLPDTDQNNLWKIVQCFIEHLPKTTQASYQVYHQILEYLNNLDLGCIFDTLNALDKAKIKQKNLDKLVSLQGHDLKVLANLLRKLRTNDLLTQENFDQLVRYQQTPNILTIFLSVANALEDSDRLNRENWPTLYRLMSELHQVQLLTQENIDKLINLPENGFRVLNYLLHQLSIHDLLTQENFDKIAIHFERPEILGVIVSAVDTLRNSHFLTQENLNSILENAMEAGNIAAALIVLAQANLLTELNRGKLLHSDNRFLHSNEAYCIGWRRILPHLLVLPSMADRQSIFDQFIDIAQQAQAEEKMQRYMNSLLTQKRPSILRNTSLQFFPTQSTDTEQDSGLRHDSVKQFSLN